MKFDLRLMFSCLAASAIFVGCDKKPVDVAPLPAAPQTVSTNPPAAALKPEFAKLPGKWHRTDGDYLVQIKSVDADGKLDAGYFNPNPIHISRALAFEKEGGTKVFIELRDVNYPGSTYTLAYDPKTDELFGQYFQAAMQQTFDVTFERVKE